MVGYTRKARGATILYMTNYDMIKKPPDDRQMMTGEVMD